MSERFDMPLPDPLLAFADALTAAGNDAVLVGGAVRDALLGRPVYDFDLVTDAPAEKVRAVCDGAAWARSVYAVGERFGTLGVVLADGTPVEVSAYRADAGALATLELRFAADAAHRDFTANAIGVALPDAMLLDPLGGRADLEARTLRAPGDAVERFAEDPLRVLRACRLVSQLGFEVEPATQEAATAAAAGLERIACERVREELTKLLMGKHVDDGLWLLRDTGALAAVLPEVAALDGVTQPTFHDLDVLGHTIQTVGNTPPDKLVRWAALLHDIGKALVRSVDADGRIRFLGHAAEGARIAEKICRRLRFSNADTSAVVHLVAEHMRLGEVNRDNPRSVDRAVRRLDLVVDGEKPRVLASAEQAVELAVADFAATAHRAETAQVRARLEAVVSESRERGSHRPVRSPVSGQELMRALGLEQGPQVGAAKFAIEQAIVGGDLDAHDAEGALAIARRALGYNLP